MKRLIVLALTTSVCATGIAAEAAPKAPKPVAMTYFLHGSQVADEAASNTATGEYGSMDATAPSGSQSKSKQVMNYVGGPNTACAGNSLFPTFIGLLAGDANGEMKITFSSVAAPATSVNIQVFADVEGQACNADFPKVAGAVTVELPVGQGKTTAVIKNLKLKAKGSFMVHFAPLPLSTGQARIFYDSATDNSSVAFSCLPKAGKKTC